MEETAPSGKAKTQRKPSQKTPRQNARVSDGDAGTGTSKGTSERKGRRGSARGASKEDVKKGNQSKRPNQENASAEVDKVSKIMLSTPPQVQLVQMQSYGNIEASDKKSSGVSVPAVPTSNLPDLNSSALKTSTTLSTAFRQPFTDLQQVQLRAQIFVYGSLMSVLFLLFHFLSLKFYVCFINYYKLWYCFGLELCRRSKWELCRPSNWESI